MRLNRASGQRFHNHSSLDFEKLKGDADHIAQHLVSYMKGFSANVRRIFEYFELENEIEKMREANILYLVVLKFRDVDLHPDRVPNEQMGLIFENLIRRFNELANETAGDHFTPREVIRLMVSILFIEDDKLLATPGTVRKLLDPACGTGGMLAEAQNYLRDHHGQASLYVYGQDYNKRAFATAASDMLMKQVDHNGGGNNIRFGDSFIEDQFAGETFDYFLTNPPFGVDWKKQHDAIERERDKLGFAGRFGAGLPRVNDGALLFLQHMIAKFEPVRPVEHKHGSRLAIVFSGSPLFTGGAGSGESDIRKWIIERTGSRRSSRCPSRCSTTPGLAPTSGSSPTARAGAARARSSSSTRATSGRPAVARKASAASATSAATSRRASSKRSSGFTAASQKLFRSVFTQRDSDAEPVVRGGRPSAGASAEAGGDGYEPDPDRRDFENVPLKEDIDVYFGREVLPHVSDAWMDRSKDKVGYEINFNRHFYKYTPPRPLEEIDAELKQAEEEILRLLREVTE